MRTSLTIGVIGSGMIGSAVARMAIRAGHQVSIANSRGPQSLSDLIAQLGPNAKAVDLAAVTQHADLVVLAFPLRVYQDLPRALFAGQVLVDTTNYYPERFGHLPELDASGLPSSAFLQARWPDARLVKALNTMDYLRLEALSAGPGGVRTAVPVAADDAAALTLVSHFVSTLGFYPLPTGGLADTWRYQPGTPLHVQAYLRYPDEPIDDPMERFTRAVSVPADVERTAALLARATQPT